MSDTTATLEGIVQKVKRVRKTANGWEGLCPAHLDHKASLSVAMDAGNILLHCHAGCRPETIVEKLGLEMQNLFPRQLTKRKLVAKYDYTDANGKLLYQILRNDPKDFTA